MAHMQLISNIADLGMSLQAALEAPRFLSFQQGPECNVIVEKRMPPEIREALMKKGHHVELTSEYLDLTGIGEAVLWDSHAKTQYGASDPRGDGAAVPELPPW
jgi:gamma-glutamyltranspeptidase / glutathione hydrolase